MNIIQGKAYNEIIEPYQCSATVSFDGKRESSITL